MRNFAIAIAALTLASTANAATLGDALSLIKNIKIEADRRCPEVKSSDSTSFTPVLKCRRIEMSVIPFAITLAQLGNRLMEDCIKEIRAGKPFESCQATNENYKKVVLEEDVRQMYLKLRAQYDALLHDWPLRHR